MKNLQRNNKKYSLVTLAPRITHATLTGQAMQTINLRRLEQQRSKHAMRQQQQRQKLPSSF
jgi:hypothetical protein